MLKNHPTEPAPNWRAWLLIGLLATGIGGDANATESLQNQRDAFQIADQALRNGTPVDYSALRDYPLYPYLRYRDLSRRLPEFPASEVRDFLQTYSGSPLAGPLRNTWLRRLAEAKRWEDYLRDAIPNRDPTFECWRRQALLNTGQPEPALRDFATLWLRGASLPTTCDPVIAAWRIQGNPTPDQVWQRFALAMTGGNLELAKGLRAALPAADQPLADAWLAVADSPQRVLDAARLVAADPRTAAILNDGLKRWGKRDPVAAAAAFDTLKTRYPAFAPQLNEAERLLALWIASDFHPTALARLNGLPEAAVDGPVREWRVRVSLRQGDWAAALRGLDQLSPTEQASPRWQYWRGRTLEALGRAEEAQAVYRNLAGQRDYHGFLAADRLNFPYAIPSIPLQIPPTELDAVLMDSPGLQRARELYVLGRESEADAEWRRAIQNFDRAAFQQAAQLAHQWAWHPQAIATIARAESWDDLDLRFPLAYRDGVINSASAEMLDPAWAYAIIRQESSFRADARSPAGAVGLMQIMPATGREIAQDLRDATATPDLARADLNIRYGAHYLQQLLGRLQNNPLLATAAYNAGPNKIAQWLPAHDSMAADVWAETIPYQETRSYVQRVMEYAAIYTQRLGAQEPANRLGSRMKRVLPIKTKSAG
jgi:soluble lytic murein transglycosylase